jgi:hypothetical protein
MTGEHAMRHFKELRTGDTVDAYTGTDGPHRGEVSTAQTVTGGITSHTRLTIDCTVCDTVHSITDSPWRLVAAVRQP